MVRRRKTTRLISRDHGHSANICNSYGLARPQRTAGEPCSVANMWETGELFLACREALETEQSITLNGYTSAAMSAAPA